MKQLGLMYGAADVLVAGVDEAGRGPLAGPVIAAAVILRRGRRISGLADSKLLTAKKRRRLAAEIRAKAHAWALGRADHDEIDRLNILNAALLAMRRAVEALEVAPGRVLVDGNRCPVVQCLVEPVIKGDRRIRCISAASILAKVARDEEMVRLDGEFPGYGFARNKGYPTPQHFRALDRLGVSPVHRRSFAPVQRCLEAAS